MGRRARGAGVPFSKPEAWQKFRATHAVGQVIRVKVVRHVPYGVVVSGVPDVFMVVDTISLYDDANEFRAKGAPPLGFEANAVIVDFYDDTLEVKLSFRKRDVPGRS